MWRQIALLVIFLSMNASVTAFTLIPAKEHGGLWDVWVLHANDTYYLFYGGAESGFGVATSKDGVHWREYEHAPVGLPHERRAYSRKSGSTS